MALNYVTLTLDLYDGQGNPVIAGEALFTPTAQLTDTTNHELITLAPVPCVFHSAGTPAVKLLATDNGPPAPAGWAWTVTFTGVAGNPASFSFFLPYASGSAQNLSAQAPVSAPSSLLGTSAAGVSVYPSGDTSGATDQANVTAAEATGRKVFFAPGTFYVTGLTKKGGTYWEGAGIGATILQLANGANADVIKGQNFSTLTLTGAKTWGVSGIWDFGISGMTIDGNASNQSGTSYGIRVYGYQWTFRDLSVRNCLTSGIWTEWGLVSTQAPVTSNGSESTASNVKVSFNGIHGWMHLGPSDVRMHEVICYENNQTSGAASIGFWALSDQVSNICLTDSTMNGTSASGFTGTFTVQAAALGNPTDLYASSGTLQVATSGTTAVMTYTGKTATTFTGCTVTSGSGTFQTGNSVMTYNATTGKGLFTCNGLQLVACHAWSNNHTWAAVLDGQVSDVDCHWEGAQYGQLLIRNSVNKAGGFIYDFSTIATGCGIQLGDTGSTSGVPQTASIAASAIDLRTCVRSFLNDTAARSSLNWVNASQASVDLLAVTKTGGTFATTIAAGSNGVDLSTFTGGSPGTLSVASTQNIPAGAGTLTIATSNGNQTATYTGTNGSNGPLTRTTGTTFTGVVAVGVPGSSTMSTGGAVSLANIGSKVIGGTTSNGSRIRVQGLSSTTALSTGASLVQEFGARTMDIGTSAFLVRSNGSALLSLSGSTGKFTVFPRYNTAPAVVQPSNPTATASTTLVMMGLGSACAYTPTGSGLVLVTVTGARNNLTAATNLTAGCRYSSGTAPSNSASATGTRFGGAADITWKGNSLSPNSSDPLAWTDVLTLTPNTAYWFDIALSTTNASDSAQVLNISMTFAEL